jgi:hypothetical protein
MTIQSLHLLQTLQSLHSLQNGESALQTLQRHYRTTVRYFNGIVESYKILKPDFFKIL